MNAVVLCKSCTGITERYAGWIADALGCKAFGWKERKNVRLSEYDLIVFGGRFHAGSIDGLKWFKSHLPDVQGKKVAVFATGAMPAGAPDISKALAQNIPEEQQKTIPVFYFPGGLCYERMGCVDKLMMAMFRKMVEKTQGDGEMLRQIQSSYDLSSKEYIEPLLAAVR